MPDESTVPVMPPVVDGGAVDGSTLADASDVTGADGASGVTPSGGSDTAGAGGASGMASSGSDAASASVDSDATSSDGGTASTNSTSGADVTGSNSATPSVAFSNAEMGEQLANNPVVVAPGMGDTEEQQVVQEVDIPAEVALKIGESHNVLIAISSDPSVDELAAAIGLSIYLDKMGKRATAIYSGTTPNALEFLKPEETFESTADTLQDFVIALNKDKADHLRYKLDGDYVKIYITPYKHRLSEEDLEFSYGDFNVDLVLALDVANGIDLDDALREHGRIMHDAVIVNITTGNPGKFGEIEWSNKKSSSVSEMIAGLLYSMNGRVSIEKEEATAFLTGIVAATNRFSNASTTPDTMRMASRLMESGANQQLISKHITPDVDNEMFSMNMEDSSEDDESKLEVGVEKADLDPTKLDIGHGNEENIDETKEVSDAIAEKESTLLDDLKAAEASLAASSGLDATTGNVEPTVGGDAGALVENSSVDGGASIGGEAVGGVPAGDVPSVGDMASIGGDVASIGGEAVGGVPSDGVSAGGVPVGDTALSTGASLEGAALSDGNVVGDTVVGDGASIGDMTSVDGETSVGDAALAGGEAIDTTSTGDSVTSGMPTENVAGGDSLADSGVAENNAVSGVESTISSTVDSGVNENLGGVGAASDVSNSGVQDLDLVDDSEEDERAEKVISPASDFGSDSSEAGADKYSKMLEDALKDINEASVSYETPTMESNGVPANGAGGIPLFGNVDSSALNGNTIATSMDMNASSGAAMGGGVGVGTFGGTNPAVVSAPVVPSNPEINGVPSINYMPMPGEEVLPPPPAPPIDMSASSGMSGTAGMSLPGMTSGAVAANPSASVGNQPVASSFTLPGTASLESNVQSLSAPASDPGAFKIPGM